jgi:signal transduction histidine kinase
MGLLFKETETPPEGRSSLADAKGNRAIGANSSSGAKPARTKSFSLTWRIIAAVLACQLLLGLGLAGVAILYARLFLRASFNTALDGGAMSLVALVRYTDRQPHHLVFQPKYLQPPADPGHPNLFEIRGSDGRLIYRSPGWDAVPPYVAQYHGQYRDFLFRGTPYRAVILRGIPTFDTEEDLPPESLTVYFASSLEQTILRQSKLAGYIALTTFGLLIVANSFAIWSIRRGLDPLHELAEQAGRISVRNWDFRPSSRATMAKELAPLSQAIETVLAGLKKAFRRQRDFTYDAAHELKTSVAIVKSALQSLLHRPRTQREYEIGLEGLLEDCARLEDLLGRMLRLARIEQLAENGALPKSATTELTSTCEAAIARMRTLAEERDVSLEFVGPRAMALRADPEDLELIWINLLENAVRYSPAGSVVKMHAGANGGAMAQVSVFDSGPGIPPGELPHIFERFHRADPSRARSSGGFGLGLAICKALVDAYGGKIEAINQAGQGAEMRVHLPLSNG